MTAQPLPGPLEGLVLLETGTELGAWCGKLLADMGARVIKVEPPSGERSRSYEPFYQDTPGPNRSLFFWHYNTSKQSVTLDAETKRGQDLFRRLTERVDGVVDSNDAGYLDGLGLGYSALSQANPGLIMAGITPFGQDGPYRQYASTDLTAIAFGGPAWSSGYDDHALPPIRGGGNQAYHTVCHFAVIGVLIALLHRRLTGQGQYIDANMHAALNVTTEGGSYNWLVARLTVQRQTGRHAGVRPSAPVQVQCGDGRYVNVGFPARTEEQWHSLLAWLEQEGLLGGLGEYLSPPNREAMQRGDPAALEQMRRISESIAALARKNNAYDLFRKAQSLGFQWGIIYSPEEVLDDPHFQARGFPTEVAHPELGRSFRYPGAPYRFTASPWRIGRRAPLLGEDNAEVYGRLLGLSSAAIAELKQHGVV